MHTKSAKKRHRQSLENREKNRSTKAALKTYVKRVTEAIKAGDVAKAEGAAKLTQEKLDRAAAKKIIHKNAASRTKSRVAAMVKAAKTAAKAK